MIPSTWTSFIADPDFKLKSVEALSTLSPLLPGMSLKSLESFHNPCSPWGQLFMTLTSVSKHPILHKLKSLIKSQSPLLTSPQDSNPPKFSMTHSQHLKLWRRVITPGMTESGLLGMFLDIITLVNSAMINMENQRSSSDNTWTTLIPFKLMEMISLKL